MSEKGDIHMPKLPPRCPFCRRYWHIYSNKDNSSYAEHTCGETHQLRKYITATTNYDLLEKELYQFEEDSIHNLARFSTFSDYHGSYPPRKTCGLLEEDD